MCILFQFVMSSFSPSLVSFVHCENECDYNGLSCVEGCMMTMMMMKRSIFFNIGSQFCKSSRSPSSSMASDTVTTRDTGEY